MDKPEILYTPRPNLVAPDPAGLPAHEQRALRELTAMWENLNGPAAVDGPDGDREDFFEPSLEAQAVFNYYGKQHVWLRTPHDPIVRNAATGEERPFDDCGHMPVFGPVEKSDRTPPRSEELADNYMDLRSFQTHAGRRCTLATASPDPGDSHPSVKDAALELHRKGHRRIVVKARATKRGLWIIDLPEDESGALACVEDALGWSTVQYEGRPGAFFVQEHIPMTYEYRVFVIDHSPVTGAGCIEEFMPLDRITTGPFDTQMRKVRSSSDPVSEQPALADTYRDFAKTIAAAVREESPQMRHYVVDFALDAEGQPAVVEFNGMRNSGFYASDVDRIVEAFARAEPTRVDELVPDPLAGFFREIHGARPSA